MKKNAENEKKNNSAISDMREEYDFSNANKNPYIKNQQKSDTFNQKETKIR